MARVAVIGLGNIGSVFAGHLIAGGMHEVTGCVRTPIPEITVEAPAGEITVPVNCVIDTQGLSPVDWILLALKSQDTASAAPWIEALCKPGTRLAVLQNGVDQENRVEPYRASAAVVPTVVFTNSKRLGRTRVLHRRPEFDLAVPDTPDGRALVDLYSDTDIRIQPETDFVTAAWRKFLINLVANPLTAVTGQGIGVLRQPDMEALARELLKESVLVARAAGAKLESDAADAVLQWLSGFPADLGTSMLEDRLANKPLEQEAITGTAVRLGRDYGIPTPVNSMLLAILRALDTRI